MLIEQLKRMNEALTRQKSDKAAAKPEPAPNHLPAQVCLLIYLDK